jgi:D-alanyl-D-alanine carboxypeptidase/D-alanyl-D-alanine-endopeptidase (penicillin-binding protein 4)
MPPSVRTEVANRAGRDFYSSMLRRWSIRAAVVAFGLGLGSLGLIQEPPTRPLDYEPGEAEMEVSPSFPIIPELEIAPHEGSLLERRLAALAAFVETRQAPPEGPVQFDVEGLGQDLQAVLERIDDQAQVSVHIRDLETQHVLFDYFGDTPLNPASNQKILTSSAALDLLGPDYRFTTQIVRSGRDLVIVGGGDPMIDDDELRVLVEEVAAAVDPAEFERIVVDDTAFSTRRFGPGYPEEGPGYAYEAPSGALSLNFNSISIHVARQRGSSQPLVTVEPVGAHIVIDNQARVGAKRSGPWVRTYADGDKTVVEVTGRLSRRSRGTTVRRRVTDPGLYAASVFSQILADATASEPLPVVRGKRPSEAETVLTHESQPLIEILDSGLAYSNNFIAEQVLRTMAWQMTGHPGDWKSGQSILYDYWSALGGDPQAVVENASGLSREGRLTTSGLVDLICVAHRHAHGPVHRSGPAGAGTSGHRSGPASPGPQGTIIDALPVAGEPGTLRSRLRKSGKRVRAKTGTLRGVSGLTGVLTTEAGEPQVAFSILINVEEGTTLIAKRRRRVEDKVVMALLEHLDEYEARRSGIVEG